MKMILACALVVALTACASPASAPQPFPVPGPGPGPYTAPTVEQEATLTQCALTQPIWQCALQLGIPWGSRILNGVSTSR